MTQLDVVVPDDALQFEGEGFPAVVVPPAGDFAAADWVSEHRQSIEDLLAKSGAILFRGFPIKGAQSFDDFSAAFDYPDFTYQQSLSNAVRINHTDRVFTANEAPPDVEIFLHHEMAQTPIYPTRLFFYCQQAAEEGGATPVCRSDKLYEALCRHDPQWAARFEQHGVKYKTFMPFEPDPSSGQGRSWKSTLGVEDPQAAEARLHELGYSFEWQADDSLVVVSPALPAVKPLPDGSKAFFNQLIAAYQGWKRVKEDPSSALQLGDGSPIPASILDDVTRLAGPLTYDLAWQDGDVAMVDNYRVMHGRRPYRGARKRSVLVAMGAP